jgi:hypothetical protein
MIPRFISLSGITRENRNEMIWRIKEAILRAGADVTDFQMFSNIAVSINFEVSAGNLGNLRDSLARENFLDRESRDSLTEYESTAARLSEKAGKAGVMCLLHVTFVHDEPDLRIEVPPVPG